MFGLITAFLLAFGIYSASFHGAAGIVASGIATMFAVDAALEFRKCLKKDLRNPPGPGE